MIPDIDNVRIRAFRLSKVDHNGEIDLSLYLDLLRQIQKAGGVVIDVSNQWLNDGSYAITISYRMPEGDESDYDIGN